MVTIPIIKSRLHSRMDGSESITSTKAAYVKKCLKSEVKALKKKTIVLAYARVSTLEQMTPSTPVKAGEGK